MELFSNPSNQPQIGQLVNHIWSPNLFRIITTKAQPHKCNYGVPEIDAMGYVVDVAPGYDFVAVDTSLDFSPYYLVRASDLR